MAPLTVIQVPQSNEAKQTITTVGNTSVKIANKNPYRQGLIIFNNSSNSMYVSFKGPAVAANCIRVIASYSSWEYQLPVCYTGEIYAIRNSGTGAVTVWEF